MKLYPAATLRTLRICTTMLCGLAPAAAHAAGYNYTTIAVAGAATTVFGAISSLGDVAGYWTDASSNQHGFVSLGGKLTTIDVPGAIATSATGVNSAGTVVGYDSDTTGHVHGFVWSKGVITRLNMPGSSFTEPLQINDNGEIIGVTITATGVTATFIEQAGVFKAIPVGSNSSPTGLNAHGEIVGIYQDANSQQQGFVRSPSGKIHRLTILKAGLVQLTAVNNSNSFVGYYFNNFQPSPNLDGFVQKGSVRTTIAHPGTTSTEPSGINAAGLIVGYYPPPNTQTLRSFVYDGVHFTPVGPATATETDAQAINDAGKIAGNFTANAGNQVFVATPK